MRRTGQDDYLAPSSLKDGLVVGNIESHVRSVFVRVNEALEISLAAQATIALPWRLPRRLIMVQEASFREYCDSTGDNQARIDVVFSGSKWRHLAVDQPRALGLRDRPFSIGPSLLEP